MRQAVRLSWTAVAVGAGLLLGGARGEDRLAPVEDGGGAGLPFGLRGNVSVSALYISGETGFIESGEGWRSQLVYPLDGWLARVAGNLRLPVRPGGRELELIAGGSRTLSLDVSGTSTDRDWDGGGELWSYSASDSDADVSAWRLHVGAALPLRPDWLGGRVLRIGATLGGGVFESDYDDRNLRPGDFIGPVSTYDIRFTSRELGLFADLQATERFGLRADVAWQPWLRGEGDALWILRNYPFWHEADGTGLELALTADWQLARYLSVFAGYRYVTYTADEDGVESGILDGTDAYENAPIVDELTADYSTVELGAALTF